MKYAISELVMRSPVRMDKIIILIRRQARARQGPMELCGAMDDQDWPIVCECTHKLNKKPIYCQLIGARLSQSLRIM